VRWKVRSKFDRESQIWCGRRRFRLSGRHFSVVRPTCTHPPTKANSCEPSDGSKNAEAKKKQTHISSSFQSSKVFVLPVLRPPTYLLDPSPLALVSIAKCNVKLRRRSETNIENDGEFFIIGLTAGYRADIDTRKARSYGDRG
jgi:hypothetical protein